MKDNNCQKLSATNRKDLFEIEEFLEEIEGAYKLPSLEDTVIFLLKQFDVDENKSMEKIASLDRQEIANVLKSLLTSNNLKLKSRAKKALQEIGEYDRYAEILENLPFKTEEPLKLTKAFIIEFESLKENSLEKGITFLLEKISSEHVASAEVLEFLNKTETIEMFENLLNHNNSEIKNSAAIALCKTNKKLSRRILFLLEDENSVVRWHTCGLLYQFGNKSAVPSLIKRLKMDMDSDVRVGAAFALGMIGNQNVIPHLEYAKQHDHTSGTHHAVSDAANLAIEEILQRKASTQQTE